MDPRPADISDESEKTALLASRSSVPYTPGIPGGAKKVLDK